LSDLFDMGFQKAPQLTPGDVVKALCDCDDSKAIYNQVMEVKKDNLISIIDHIRQQCPSLTLPSSQNLKKQRKYALQNLFQDNIVFWRDDIKRSQDKREENDMKITTPSSLSTLPKSVEELMSLIFSPRDIKRRMQYYGYRDDKVPLEKISEQKLSEAKVVLKRLADIPGPKTVMDKVSEIRMAAWNDYNSLIPRRKSDRRPGHCEYGDEVMLLQDLYYMKIANDIMNLARTGANTTADSADLLNRQYQGLGMKEMTPVEKESPEFQEIKLYFRYTVLPADRHYEVRDIFRIKRGKEEECFQKYANIRKSQRRLLWYGPRYTNFAGILRQGLRVPWPEAPDCGSPWGQGIYLHDFASDAVATCEEFPYDSDVLLLLCEVELGQTSKVTDKKAARQRQPYLSTLVTGRCGIKWKDAECLHPSLKGVQMYNGVDDTLLMGKSHYHQWIVYDGAQIRPKYLVRVKSFPPLCQALPYCQKKKPGEEWT
jgi:poly [ADP-ribose] polymerase